MKYLLTCFVVSVLLSCSSNEKRKLVDNNPDSTTQFFPIASFFNQQIREVDSLKLPTVKYMDANNRKDTVAISLEEFKAIANEFLASDITTPALKNEYKESSFADQSIPSVTLNYTTSN